MKKEYIEPSMEAVEMKVQQMLASSPGSGTHTDDSQDPGKALAPGLFEGDEWDILLGE